MQVCCFKFESTVVQTGKPLIRSNGSARTGHKVLGKIIYSVIAFSLWHTRVHTCTHTCKYTHAHTQSFWEVVPKKETQTTKYLSFFFFFLSFSFNVGDTLIGKTHWKNEMFSHCSDDAYKREQFRSSDSCVSNMFLSLSIICFHSLSCIYNHYWQIRIQQFFY